MSQALIPFDSLSPPNRSGPVPSLNTHPNIRLMRPIYFPIPELSKAIHTLEDAVHDLIHPHLSPSSTLHCPYDAFTAFVFQLVTFSMASYLLYLPVREKKWSFSRRQPWNPFLFRLSNRLMAFPPNIAHENNNGWTQCVTPALANLSLLSLPSLLLRGQWRRCCCSR